MGTLRPSEAKEEEIKKDMEELRETATKMVSVNVCDVPKVMMKAFEVQQL